MIKTRIRCSRITSIAGIATCTLTVFVGCDKPVSNGPVSNGPVANGPANETTPTSEQPDAPIAEVVDPKVVEPQPAEQEPIEITFDDLNIQIQADIVFRPWMLSDRVKELDGKRVRVAGYMLPGSSLEKISEFVLLRNTECKFGPGGKADHLLSATLRSDETTSFRNYAIQIDGTLQVSPYEGPDGNTWSIYELHDANHVVRVRR